MICPFCVSGHRFMEVRPKLYAKVSTATTRLYLGNCKVCDGKGNMKPLPFDFKSAAAGEAAQQ